MPLLPSTWYPGPLSPQQLNKDLYSYDGTGYGAAGILFHAHRPLMHESLSQSRALTVTTSGNWTQIAGSATTAFNIVDTGALFGTGCDGPGGNASYQFTPNALAASGVAILPGGVAPTGNTTSSSPAAVAGAGGNYLVFHTATAQTAATTPAAIGAGMFADPGFGEIFEYQGGMQPHTAGTQGAAYYLDLINAGGGSYGFLASGVAYEQICAKFLPQGAGWTGSWIVQIAGTASSADVNNFALVLGGQTIATSTNVGSVGTYLQSSYTVASTIPSGELLTVTVAGNTPTSQSTYSAEIFGTGLPRVSNATTWQPSAWLADASAVTEQLPASAADTAGFTPRHTWVWASVSYQGQLSQLNAEAYASDGNTTGWSAQGGTVTAVTGIALPGYPLQPNPYGVLLAPSGGSTAATAVAGSFAATAATVYQVTSQVFITSSFTVQTGVNWYDVTGAFLSATTGGATALSASVWTPVTSWNTAPAGAVTGAPYAQVVSGSSIPATVSTYICGVTAVNPQPPAPQITWSGALTSDLMNGPAGPKQALTFLNNPPVMRAVQGLVTSIPNTAPTQVSFPAAVWPYPGIDTYNAYNTATGLYAAPVAGLYLAFACLPFTASSTGVRYAGFQVTAGGTATTFAGPAYSAVTVSGAPTSACAFRVLDLAASDTVAPVAYQNSGGSLALTDGSPGYTSRFGMYYLTPYSTGGVNSATTPVTSFHWFAGIPPSQLPGFMNAHLGNDLSFLMNRPYFTGYQATAQTGLANGSWNTVTIDTPGGIVRGSVGDNYAGWNATANAYVAQQPGWYLVMAEVYASLPAAATGFIYAGINCPSSGGIAPSASPDQYQTMFHPSTTGPVPGAAAIGVYFLAAGESVQPMIKCAGWGGSYSTAVGSNPAVASQMTCIWIAELETPEGSAQGSTPRSLGGLWTAP